MKRSSSVSSVGLLSPVPNAAAGIFGGSIGSVGVAWGLQIGLQVAESVIALWSEGAIRAFDGKGQMRLGGEAALTVGPIGRSFSLGASLGLDSNNSPSVAGMHSYSRSQGLYGGATFEGMVLAARCADNETLYKAKLSVHQVLYEATPPGDAAELYAELAILEKEHQQVEQEYTRLQAAAVQSAEQTAERARYEATLETMQSIGDGIGSGVQSVGGGAKTLYEKVRSTLGGGASAEVDGHEAEAEAESKAVSAATPAAATGE